MSPVRFMRRFSLRGFAVFYDLAPFERSVLALLEVIARNGNADGVSLYEYGVSTRMLSLTACAGQFKPQVERACIELPDGASSWLERVCEPTLVEGVTRDVLLCGFHSAAVALVTDLRWAKVFLHVGWRSVPDNNDFTTAFALVSGLEQITARAAQVHDAQKLVADIARLQSELADSKIADRTSGLLATSMPAQVASESICRHIERVLQSADESVALLDRVKQLEMELSGRHAIARAKQVLEEKHSITEQQAYLLLKNASRRTRRP